METVLLLVPSVAAGIVAGLRRCRCPRRRRSCVGRRQFRPGRGARCSHAGVCFHGSRRRVAVLRARPNRRGQQHPPVGDSRLLASHRQTPHRTADFAGRCSSCRWRSPSSSSHARPGLRATVQELRAAPRGWDSDGIVAVRMAPLPGRYDGSFESSLHYRQLLERIDALPGVETAALSNTAPPVPAPYRESVAPADRADLRRDTLAFRVSDGFFATLRLPLTAGSDFVRSDRPSGERTAIVSVIAGDISCSATSGRWGNTSRWAREPADQAMRIVGVAADGTLGDPRAGDQPAVYRQLLAARQRLSTVPDAAGAIGCAARRRHLRIREEIAEAGREYPLAISLVVDNLDDALVQERLLAITSAMFAAIGLLLAGIGLFGVVNVAVVSRTKELGIRMAVGASRRHVISSGARARRCSHSGSESPRAFFWRGRPAGCWPASCTARVSRA